MGNYLPNIFVTSWNRLTYTVCIQYTVCPPKKHMCLGQLGVSVQLKKFKNLFRGFGIFSEIVRVTLYLGHTVYIDMI